MIRRMAAMKAAFDARMAALKALSSSTFSRRPPAVVPGGFENVSGLSMSPPPPLTNQTWLNCENVQSVNNPFGHLFLRI